MIALSITPVNDRILPWQTRLPHATFRLERRQLSLKVMLQPPSYP